MNDWLIVGGDLWLAASSAEDDPEDVALALIERGVSHVLDARAEWTDSDVWWNVDPSIRYYHAPIVDERGHCPSEAWYLAIEEFVQEFLLFAEAETSGTAKLYVHCQAGINRGPSAAMLALLTADPGLDPFEAFLTIRSVRPISGLVYAEEVGKRHLRLKGAGDEQMFVYSKALTDYWQWDHELSTSANRRLAYDRHPVVQ